MAIFFNFDVSKISTNGDSIWLRVIQYGFEFMGTLPEAEYENYMYIRYFDVKSSTFVR